MTQHHRSAGHHRVRQKRMRGIATDRWKRRCIEDDVELSKDNMDTVFRTGFNAGWKAHKRAVEWRVISNK